MYFWIIILFTVKKPFSYCILLIVSVISARPAIKSRANVPAGGKVGVTTHVPKEINKTRVANNATMTKK